MFYRRFLFLSQFEEKNLTFRRPVKKLKLGGGKYLSVFLYVLLYLSRDSFQKNLFLRITLHQYDAPLPAMVFFRQYLSVCLFGVA